MTDPERIALLTLERDALLAQCDKLQAQVQELLALLDQVTSLLARKKKAQGQPIVERETMNLTEYYECGICGCYHPATWNGDCRDDENRFNVEDLDAMHGEYGWREVSMPS